jgi:hypothetical protein
MDGSANAPSAISELAASPPAAKAVWVSMVRRSIMVFLEWSVRLPDVSRDAINKPSLKLNFVADLNSV